MDGLTDGASLEEYYGALSEETAGELEDSVSRRRTEQTSEQRERVKRFSDTLD
ncbi:hypothetical protein ACLI4Z_14775 [Natrialbaceae archaeon A-arb3/5]